MKNELGVIATTLEANPAAKAKGRRRSANGGNGGTVQTLPGPRDSNDRSVGELTSAPPLIAASLELKMRTIYGLIESGCYDKAAESIAKLEPNEAKEFAQKSTDSCIKLLLKLTSGQIALIPSETFVEIATDQNIIGAINYCAKDGYLVYKLLPFIEPGSRPLNELYYDKGCRGRHYSSADYKSLLLFHLDDDQLRKALIDAGASPIRAEQLHEYRNDFNGHNSNARELTSLMDIVSIEQLAKLKSDVEAKLKDLKAKSNTEPWNDQLIADHEKFLSATNAEAATKAKVPLKMS